MEACAITPTQSPRAQLTPRSKDSSRGSPYSHQDGCMMWLLPDEIIMSLLGFLSIDDLCSVVQTCWRLNMLGNSKSVLSKISFGDYWPDAKTSKLYQKAARANNFEANIKLGVACLYGEGCEASPEIASEMLIRAEQITGSADPFSWLLYRPPWSSDTCSKACIFRDMKKLSEQYSEMMTKKYCGIMFCVAKTMWLQSGDTNNAEAKKWFEVAAERGCGEAAFELFKILNGNGNHDVGQRVDSIRYLREHGFSQSLNVQMALCSEYAKGYFAGASADETIAYFRDVVAQQSRHAVASACAQKDLDKQGKMRYILVDWLVEVADLKQFTRDTLYMTVSLVDRYLSQRVVTRKTLQLLGIACMVIAARFSENEVITIREAAWLTDNTYTYEKVVRTMGKALCAARGQLRVSTHLDFLRLLISLGSVDPHTEELMHFVSELVLLHMTVANTSPVLVAAAVFFITKFSIKTAPEHCWPELLQQWTNLSVQDIASTVLDIQECCFQLPTVKDHRGVELQAVNERYERRTGKSVKDFAPPSTTDIQPGLASCCNLAAAHAAAQYASAPPAPPAPELADTEMADGDASARASASPGAPMELDGTGSAGALAAAGPARSGAVPPLSEMTNAPEEPLLDQRPKRSSSITTPMVVGDYSSTIPKF